MSRLPETEQSLLRHLRAEKRQRLRNEGASPYSRSGMGVTAEGVVTLDGEIDITGLAKIIGRMLVEGTLDITGPTTIGGRLDVDGPMAVTGTLSLPAGIINNDALANPVTFRSDWGSASNFALPNAWTEYASCFLTVPAGYTQMQFDVIASILAGNTLSSTQYLMAYIGRQINGVGPVYNSITDQATLPAGFFASAMAPYKWDEVVTPGDVHRFSLMGWAGGGAWGASANNYARIEASALFTR